MLIRLKLARHPRGEEAQDVFPGLLPPARPRILPLAYSVGIHAAVLSLLPAVSQYGMTNNSGRVDLARYKVEMLPLRVPLYFSQASAPAPPVRRSSAVAKKGGGPAAPRRGNPTPEPAAPPRAVKPFELPTPVVRAKNAPLILQPEAAPAVQQAKALPSMAFWARLESGPKRPVREFVTPGRTEQPAPAPKLDAPPVLAVPNRQPKPGDVNVALASSPARPTRLFVQNSSTVPMRLQRDAGASEAASLDAVAGEAANLIILGAPRPPAGLIIEVPKGLSQSPAGEPARAGSGGAAGASGGAGKQTGSSGRTANSGAAAESGRAKANAQGNQSSQSRGSSAGAAGRSSGSGSNAAGAVLPPPAVGPSAPPPPIRITHPPVGSFDVVVAQSGAAGGDLPEAAGILTGNPIYTVYLRVGDEREWLLEYCLPGEKQVQSNPYEINIGPVIQVTPPYPLFTSIPGSLLQRRRREHIVLHGYLTANGAFRDVKAANSSDALGREILALLGDWRFRPALRDRTPIGVEVLLVVPPRAEN